MNKKRGEIMTDKISGSVMSIEEAIAYHLEYNFAVPFPQTHIPLLVPICIEAIKNVNDHNLYVEISLPKAIAWTTSDGVEHNSIPAYAVIALCRLDQWLNAEWF
jgi:hypothetical protein